ncbi:MAG: hypothetical protein SGCHY_001765 [Lobulomycetales sp.]
MKLSNATIDVLLQGKQLQELQVSTATDGKSLECFLEPFCGDCIDIKASTTPFFKTSAQVFVDGVWKEAKILSNGQTSEMKIDLDDRFTEPVGVSGDDPLPGNTRKVTIELWYVEILAEAEMSQPEPLPHSDSGHPETVMISLSGECPDTRTQPSLESFISTRISAEFSLIAEETYQFAHEAPVYLNDKLYFASNVLNASKVEAGFVDIAKTRQVAFVDFEYLNAVKLVAAVNGIYARTLLTLLAAIPMVNGAFVFWNRWIIYCANGNHNRSAGLYSYDTKTERVDLIADSWNGKPFNSANDLAITRSGLIYFTDPPYGYEQGFRPEPILGSWLYRAQLSVKGDSVKVSELRALADGFVRPNGVALSDDERVLYVADSGYIHGDGTVSVTEPRAIYAMEIGQDGLLHNQRTLAIIDDGYPDGIKFREGRLYAGCGDGVQIFNATSGNLLAKLKIQGGVANLQFGPQGELYALNECRIFSAKLSWE